MKTRQADKDVNTDVLDQRSTDKVERELAYIVKRLAQLCAEQDHIEQSLNREQEEGDQHG